jgi:hypothetical protein
MQHNELILINSNIKKEIEYRNLYLIIKFNIIIYI